MNCSNKHVFILLMFLGPPLTSVMEHRGLWLNMHYDSIKHRFSFKNPDFIAQHCPAETFPNTKEAIKGLPWWFHTTKRHFLQTKYPPDVVAVKESTTGKDICLGAHPLHDILIPTIKLRPVNLVTSLGNCSEAECFLVGGHHWNSSLGHCFFNWHFSHHFLYLYFSNVCMCIFDYVCIRYYFYYNNRYYYCLGGGGVVAQR